MNYLETALNQMPGQFNSHQFLKQLRKLGYSEFRISEGYHLAYLMRNTDRTAPVQWRKKEQSQPWQHPFERIRAEYDKAELDAVKYLTSRGWVCVKEKIK